VISLAVFTTMIVAVIVACYYVINPYKKYIVSPPNAAHTEVGLVLGAGVTKDGKPYKELQARLDSAADALNAGTVDMLLLSGDNRFKNYDEPTAMKNYLIGTRNIAPEKLVADYAGRSTYESCERAAKVFGVHQTIIFSAGSHLPRAIYLCRHFNIEASGIANNVEANNSTRRELLARVKAVYNVHLIGAPTVIGEPISLN
jgi:vancomycin permeability regulator SanA